MSKMYIKEECDLNFEAEVLSTLDDIDEFVNKRPKYEEYEDYHERKYKESIDKKYKESVEKKYRESSRYKHEERTDKGDEEYKIGRWYDDLLGKKIRIAKNRLSDLSNLVCYTSQETKERIARMEQDHSSPLCRFDIPRHPSLSAPWTNTWKFNCKYNSSSCKSNHTHSVSCEKLVLEHFPTGTTTETASITSLEFPSFVMRAVESFQEFDQYQSRSLKYEDCRKIPKFKKPTWTWMRLRCNNKKDLIMVLNGKGVHHSLKWAVEDWFSKGRGRSTRVVAVHCLQKNFTGKEVKPSYVYIKDKVGPLVMTYTPNTYVNFNSIEAQLLATTLLDYLSLTKDTIVIHIGCHIGVVTLMLADKALRVIGLNPLEHEVKVAEEIKEKNKIRNAVFLACKPYEIDQKCSAILCGVASVAVLHLAPPYGKVNEVIRSLRDLSTLWQVVVYGPLTADYHKFIAVLTSHDKVRSDLGAEFIPMRCCILDKVPITDAENFDILILFERKALIEPKFEEYKEGPTMNCKMDHHEERSPVKSEILSIQRESSVPIKKEARDRDSFEWPSSFSNIKQEVKPEIKREVKREPDDYAEPDEDYIVPDFSRSMI